MKKIVIILFVHSMIAQAQITEKSKSYDVIDTTYTLLSKSNQQKLVISILGTYENEEFWAEEYQVNVFNNKEELIQTFSNVYRRDLFSDRFNLEDINFDDKDDLCVRICEGTFNHGYEFWKYDTLTYSFLFDSLLSSVVYLNPSFDNEKKEIVTAAGSPDWTYWEKTYSYDNNNLELIMEDYQEKLAPLPNDKYQFLYRRVKKIRKGDEMIIEKEVTGTIEEIGMGWEDR